MDHPSDDGTAWTEDKKLPFMRPEDMMTPDARFPKEYRWWRRGVLIVGVLFWTAALWMAWGYIFP